MLFINICKHCEAIEGSKLERTYPTRHGTKSSLQSLPTQTELHPPRTWLLHLICIIVIWQTNRASYQCWWKHPESMEHGPCLTSTFHTQKSYCSGLSVPRFMTPKIRLHTGSGKPTGLSMPFYSITREWQHCIKKTSRLLIPLIQHNRGRFKVNRSFKQI